MTRGDLLLLLAPCLRRGFQSDSGETLSFETVELSASHCFVAIRSDRPEAERALLEKPLQELSAAMRRAEQTAVTGLGLAPRDPEGYPGFRPDSFWVQTGTYPLDWGRRFERSSENGPEEDALDEAELAEACQKLANLEAGLEAVAASRAGLEIYRQPGGRLLLELLDGYCPQAPPEVGVPAIGPAVIEFAAWLEELICPADQDPAGEAIPTGDQSEDRSRSDWPPSPGPGAYPDRWFDWYHHCKDELGYKFTLEELAKEMGLSYGHVRKLHATYMHEHGWKWNKNDTK
jgi:hypothetical protein